MSPFEIVNISGVTEAVFIINCVWFNVAVGIVVLAGENNCKACLVNKDLFKLVSIILSCVLDNELAVLLLGELKLTLELFNVIISGVTDVVRNTKLVWFS